MVGDGKKRDGKETERTTIVGHRKSDDSWEVKEGKERR